MVFYECMTSVSIQVQTAGCSNIFYKLSGKLKWVTIRVMNRGER